MTTVLDYCCFAFPIFRFKNVQKDWNETGLVAHQLQLDTDQEGQRQNAHVPPAPGTALGCNDLGEERKFRCRTDLQNTRLLYSFFSSEKVKKDWNIVGAGGSSATA